MVAQKKDKLKMRIVRLSDRDYYFIRNVMKKAGHATFADFCRAAIVFYLNNAPEFQSIIGGTVISVETKEVKE